MKTYTSFEDLQSTPAMRLRKAAIAVADKIVTGIVYGHLGVGSKPLVTKQLSKLPPEVREDKDVKALVWLLA